MNVILLYSIFHYNSPFFDERPSPAQVSGRGCEFEDVRKIICGRSESGKVREGEGNLSPTTPSLPPCPSSLSLFPTPPHIPIPLSTPVPYLLAPDPSPTPVHDLGLSKGTSVAYFLADLHRGTPLGLCLPCVLPSLILSLFLLQDIRFLFVQDLCFIRLFVVFLDSFS